MPPLITVKTQEKMEVGMKAFVLLIPLMVVFTATSVDGYIPPRSFFQKILNGASAGCKGKSFYRFSDFKDAASRFKSFGNTGSLAVRKREIAAFFANVALETGSLCYVTEISKGTYCTQSQKYPCVTGQKYYGRGPIQLTGNLNYGAAGDYFHLNLLNNPGRVATDAKLSWKTAIWYWMVNSRCHKAITGGEGFGATIRAINPGECKGGSPAAVTSRVKYFKKFCAQLGVTPGGNLRC